MASSLSDPDIFDVKSQNSVTDFCRVVSDGGNHYVAMIKEVVDELVEQQSFDQVL
jgi:hypothetical protein